YVDYWTFRFADLFRVGFYPNGYNAKWSQAYWEWIRECVSQNKPYDQVARGRIAAEGYNGPSRHFVPFAVAPIASDTMAEQVRVFMGRRMDCAQCHDHPYESWSQNQFWGLTAFFGQVYLLGERNGSDSVVFDVLPGWENAL